MFPSIQNATAQPPRKMTWEEAHQGQEILPDTPEMEAHLSVGYGGLTVSDAEAIVAHSKKDRMSVEPLSLRNAKAFLEAYHTRAKVVAKRQMIVPQPMD